LSEDEDEEEKERETEKQAGGRRDNKDHHAEY
jgi:hypothetical protein